MRGFRFVKRIGQKNKGYTKRATAISLAVALILSFGTVRADSAEVSQRGSIEDFLREELLSCAPVIDLGTYGRTPAEVGRILGTLLVEEPALFYVAPRLSYTVSGTGLGGDGAMVAAVYPSYSLTGTELAVARALFRERLSCLLGELNADGAGFSTDAEIALRVHDLLAARYDYDVRVLNGTDATNGGNRDAYRFLRDGVGVCQAYALAALALLRAAGLEADFVSSPAMDHAWVHVRVGGAWYHMDITRDDPVVVRPDGTAVAAGLVTHTRVLRSDEGMRALGYHGFSCAGGHTCTDTRYETPAVMATLSEVISPFVAIFCQTPDIPFGEAPASLVWVGESRSGGLIPLRLGRNGITAYAEGDIDGDGAVTPGDLLLLSDADLPEAWRGWMRRRLLEIHSAARTEISPDASVRTSPPTSTSRE